MKLRGILVKSLTSDTMSEYLSAPHLSLLRRLQLLSTVRTCVTIYLSDIHFENAFNDTGSSSIAIRAGLGGRLLGKLLLLRDLRKQSEDLT